MPRLNIGLAGCYLKGKGVEQNEGLALEYYKKAAEQGSAEAQNYLAHCYLEGKGVKRNEGLALEYFKKAAEQGFAGANLAHCYLEGKGVDQNTELAAKNWIANQQFLIGKSFLMSQKNLRQTIKKPLNGSPARLNLVLPMLMFAYIIYITQVEGLSKVMSSLLFV